MVEFPRREELRHWRAVAFCFRPWQQEFWLGLFHDTVEDGYLPERLLRVWPALDAISRRPGETYANFIARCGAHPVARRVKLADLAHNLARNGGPNPSLRSRYIIAMNALCDAHEREEAG